MKIRRLLALATLLVSMDIAIASRPNRLGSTGTSTNKDDPESYRLPNSTYPLEYDLKYVINPEQYELSGETRIKIMAAEQTSTIVLHAHFILNITSVTLKDANGEFIWITGGADESRDTDFWIITLLENRTLVAGESYELEFVHSFPFAGVNLAISIMTYFDTEGIERYYVATQFQPTFARIAFPCYDEPALKAVFNIHIYTPTGYNVLSNMDAITSQQPTIKNFNVTTFRSTPLMSTYLVAFAVTEFTYKSNTEEGHVIYPKEYRVHALPEAKDMLDFSLDYGQRNLLYLQEYVDLNFKLPKVDNVVVTESAWRPWVDADSTENWGLITYYERNMLYKKGLSTSEDQLLVVRSMSHSNSHSWFGNEVTPQWWDHLWLSEGFATYFEYYAADEVLMNWRLMEHFVVTKLQNVLVDDSFPSTNAMNNEVGDPDEIEYQFNSIAYYKAGSVIRMMQHLMGEELFHAAVTSYVKRLQGSVTRPEYLYEELQKSIAGTGIIPSNTNMSSIFSSWADQEGYPVVTIMSVTDSTTLIVKQERFHYNMSTHSDEKWWIPFTWTTSSNVSFDTARPTMIPPNVPEYYVNVDAGSWYIANLQQSGFYRVMYDEKNWNSLIKVLNVGNHTLIHPLNKAQLIDDAFIFAKSDRFSFNTTLSILNYLQREVDYIPWVPAERALNFLKYKMPASSLYNEYKLFVIRLTARIYDSVGMSVQDDDDHITRRTRILIAGLACEHGSPDCLRDAQSALAEEMNGGSVVDPDLRFIIDCHGVKNASSDDLWNHLFKKFDEGTGNEDFDKLLDLLAAMGCSDNNSTIESYLQKTIETYSSLPDWSKSYVVPYVALYGGPLGVHKALEFLFSNFLELRENIISFRYIFSTLGEVIVTDEQVQANIRRLLILMTLLISMDITLASRPKPNSIPSRLRSTVAPETKEDPSYRLPNSTYPLEYDLKYVINPDQYELSGETRIKIMATEQTSTIVLHAHFILNITSVTLKDANGTFIWITGGADESRDTDFWIITLLDNRTLVAGESYELEFVHSFPFAGVNLAISIMTYFDTEGIERYYVATRFQPILARAAFPCYDEPALKAIFNIHIYHPTGYHALSNMDAITSQQPPMENFKVTSFRSTPRMSTYLVAFVVTQFEYKSNTEEGNLIFPKEYRVYARPEAKDMLDFPLEFGQNNLLYLQEYIGVDYRLPKVDNIAFPYFSAIQSMVTGSVGNWGLVTYDDNYMLYKKGLSTSEEQMLVARSMSRANSLFWFGNEVTPDWWDHLWLSEGFATYFEFYAADKVLSNWRLMEQFVVTKLHDVLLDDSYPNTNAMNNEVVDGIDTYNQFNSIANLKAGSVIRMMQHLVGEEFFHAAVSSYIKRLQGGVTRPEYLYEELQKSIAGAGIIPSNTNISSIFGSWADQKGYPIVNITPGADSTTLVVKQERFHYNMSTHTEEKWWIPFTWTTSSNASFDTARPTMISPDQSEFYITIDANSWYIANLQQSGFYRVMYDDKNWNSLIKVLNTENHTLIHPLNKAQLIDDSYVFAKSYRFSLNTTLSILNYLQREVDYIPWVPAERALNFLKYKMPASSLYNEYKLFVRILTARIYDSVGMSVQDDDDHITRRTRTLIAGLACDYGSPDCLHDAQSALAEEMNGGSVVDPDLRFITDCHGVKNASSVDLWNYLFKRFNDTFEDEESEELLTLLSAMGCSDTNSTIESYLQKTIEISNPLPSWSKTYVVQYVALYGGPLGVHKVLEFLESDFLVLRRNINSFSSIFFTLGEVIVTDEQLQAFDAFYQKYKNQFTFNELDFVLGAYKEIEKQQQWIREHMGDIDSWIAENV